MASSVCCFLRNHAAQWVLPRPPTPHADPLGAPSTELLNSLPLCHPGANHDVSDRVAELHWVH